MKIKFDREADVKYVALTKARRKGAVASTKKLSDWLLADYSVAGELLGIEILNASQNDGMFIISQNKVDYFKDDGFNQAPSSKETAGYVKSWLVNAEVS